MLEKERTREQEREDWKEALDAFYRWMRLGRDQKEKRLKGKKVLKGKDQPYFQNPQAWRGHWVVHPFMEGTALDGKWTIAHHVIPTFGGKHTHQGGLVIFVLEGKGYTVVDGVRHDWEEGDLVMLPIKKGGVEHQHFSLTEGGKPAKWVMLTPMNVWEALGLRTEQNEVSPYWKGDPGLPLTASKYK